MLGSKVISRCSGSITKKGGRRGGLNIFELTYWIINLDTIDMLHEN